METQKSHSTHDCAVDACLRAGADRPAVNATQRQFVLRPGQVTNRAVAGGKAYALACLSDKFDEIPAWFVITPEAFLASRERSNQPTEAALELDALTPSAEVRQEILAALDEITSADELVAVRSSAVEEDSVGASFAGQLESYLCVSRADLWRRIADVWRSGFSQRVQVYREQKGLAGDPQPPAVLVQRMVPAEVSGIAFSTNPVSGDRKQCVVAATEGYGDRLVGGQVQGDVYEVSDDGRVEVRPETKGHVRLSHQQIRAVAKLARRAERFFGQPQDVEWAIAEGRLYLLQSRPITTLSARDVVGRVTVWDNSNIVESYSGVTSPLTFSFAQRLYEGVYRQFLLSFGVAHHTLAANEEIFRNMLGYLRGRVYYNLLNWYRLLALLPGAERNRRFLDLMLGVQDQLSDEVQRQLSSDTASPATRPRSYLAMGKLATRVLWNWLTLGRRIKSFHDRLDDALALPLRELQSLPLAELGRYYRDVEHALLHIWEAPVLNDFYCMIFFGLSREWLRRWAGPAAAALHGEFLQHSTGIISAEPAKRILSMAEIVAQDRQLRESLTAMNLGEVAQSGQSKWKRSEAIEANPQFKSEYESYLDRFGDRCLEELKLESVTTRDDPTSLLATIAYRATRPPAADFVRHEREPRQELRQLMRGKPLRRTIALWLIREATRRVRQRENLRFQRTRAFGRARHTFLQIGQRFAETGVLRHQRDIFFLTVEEVLGAINGTVASGDLAELVRIRKAEEEQYRNQPELPTRFETRGAVITALNHVQPLDKTKVRFHDTSERQGLACSPGFVRGTARVIVDPKGASISPGEILVAKHTDPGWVLLFTTAAGVVVERGSLLSHSAIVAREMGIPAVVAVPELTSWLQDGDLIELDGARGTVRRLSNDGS